MENSEEIEAQIEREDRRAYEDRLTAVLQESSIRNSRVGVFLLTVCGILLVTTLGISDKDILLGNNAFTLPFLNIPVQGKAFFYMGGTLLLLLYCVVLYNAVLHTGKVKNWHKEVYTNLPKKQQSSPHLFIVMRLLDFAHFDNSVHGKLGGLLFLLSLIVYAGLPTIILFFILHITFAYQSVTLSLFIFELAMMSSFISWLFISNFSDVPLNLKYPAYYLLVCMVFGVIAFFLSKTIKPLDSPFDILNTLTIKDEALYKTPPSFTLNADLFVNKETGKIESSQAKEIIRQYQITTAKGYNFEDRELAYIKIERSQLYSARFNGANLSHAKLINVDFHNSDIRGTIFFGSCLINVVFTGAVMDEKTNWLNARYNDKTIFPEGLTEELRKQYHMEKITPATHIAPTKSPCDSLEKGDAPNPPLKSSNALPPIKPLE